MSMMTLDNTCDTTPSVLPCPKSYRRRGAMGRKPADKVGTMVRFSERLRRRIEKAAQTNNQSMNSEIVRRLEDSFRREDTRAERREDIREAVGLVMTFTDQTVPKDAVDRERVRKFMDEVMKKTDQTDRFWRQKPEEGSKK